MNGYEIFGFEISPSSTLYDKLLSFAVLLVLVWLVVKLHGNWDGQVSTRQFQMERGGERSGLIKDAVMQVKAIYQRKQIDIYKAEDVQLNIEFEEFTTYDWRKLAANLLIAYSPQYKIDLNLDWHEEYSCYISRYGENEVPVFIHCPSKVPIEMDTRQIGLFCMSLGLGHIEKHVVIVPGDNIQTVEAYLPGNPLPQVYSEKQLLDKLSNMEGYRRYLKAFFEERPIAGGTSLTLNDTYVESSGRIYNKTEVESVEDYIKEWMEKPAIGNIAILGDYGQGKSTLCNKLAYDTLCSNKEGRIPIVIELRGKSPRTMSLDEVIYPWCRRFGVDPDALIALHAAGRLVLILEGFDEMDFVGDAALRLEHFKSLWRFAAFPLAKIIFTGRPNFFFDTGERERALLLAEEGADRMHCIPVHLKPFKRSQIKQAVRSFPNATQASLLATIDNASPESELSDLLARPSTLVWAASVWSRLESVLETGHVASAYVIGELLTQCYDRQSNKKLQTTILAAEREFFSIGIAVSMHIERPGVNQISADRLHGLVCTLAEELPDQLRDFRNATEEEQLPFSERINDYARRIESLLTDVRTCGVIVEDMSRPGHFKFAHKAFYEYLVGTYICHWRLLLSSKKYSGSIRVNNKHTVAVNALMQKRGLIPLTTTACHEIIHFAGQLLARHVSYGLGDTPGDKFPITLLHVIGGHRIFFVFSMIRIISRTSSNPTDSNLSKVLSNTAGDLCFAYFGPFVRITSWRVKMWYSGCIAFQEPTDILRGFLGKCAFNVLSGRWTPSNRSERRIANLLHIPIMQNELHEN